NGSVPSTIEAFLDDPQVMREYQSHQRSWSDLEFPYRYGLMRASSFAPLARAICFSPDLMETVKELSFPMLLFCGAADEVIPVEKTQQVAKLFRGGGCEVIKTTSVDH